MIQTAFKSRLILSLAGVAAAMVLVTGGTPSAATRVTPLSDQGPALTQAQQMFAEAPDGVDPMVTGPVSAAFRLKQADAGCDTAVWPHIPASCYPD